MITRARTSAFTKLDQADMLLARSSETALFLAAAAGQYAAVVQLLEVREKLPCVCTP